jgi:YhcN/YlaJ family sporulation lipoprotein
MKLKNILVLSVVMLIAGSISIGRYNREKLAAGLSLMQSSSENTAEKDENDIDSAKEYDETSETTELRAEKIARAVNEIEGIEKVSVIITGNSAIVGIEFIGELTDQRLIEAKRAVEKKVKSTDSTLDHVAVTAVSELITRMDKIADYSTEAEKNNGLNKEQEEQINSLTPVL